MRVFVAGATGVLGRRVLPRLVAAGHEVTGVARSAEKAARVRAAGAVPATVDLFDADAVAAAVAGHEIVVNLATHIPPTSRAALPGAWRENERIRSTVPGHLVDAALAAGATRYVQEALAFIYFDAGAAWVDEDAPVDGGSFNQGVHRAEQEVARFTAAGSVGITLRFGLFHGPDSDQTVQTVALAKRGLAMTLGRPDAYLAMIEIHDAAAAVVAAVGAPAGVYNVVDDEPLTRRQYADALSSAVGRTKPLRLPPAWMAGLGGSKTRLLARSERVRNTRFREATGWAPQYPSARESWPAIVGAMEGGPMRSDRTVRVLLAIEAAGFAVVGAWALAAPRSFYDSFPGAGRAWVSADGPYNEHLVRDVGALNLAVVAVLLFAAWSLARPLVQAAAVAALVWSVPHLAYHGLHLEGLASTADRVGNVVSLGLAVVVPVVVLWLIRRPVASTAPG